MKVVVAIACEVIPFAFILCEPLVPAVDPRMFPIQLKVPSGLAVVLQMVTDEGLASPVS